MLNAKELFAHWLDTCAANPWTPLTHQAAAPYGVIWNTWLRYISQYQLAWHEARGEHVLGFIRNSPQSARQHSASDVTRRRYWRVLDRIYDHALLHEWIKRNPAQDVARHERPPSEDSRGAILWPQMWRALQEHLPPAVDLISTRDRAVLLLLIELGLTPEEVRSLKIQDVDIPAQQLNINGQRQRQSRVLPLSARLLEVLQQWINARAEYHAMRAQEALFCSRKSAYLSSHTLLHIVSKTLRSAAHQSQLEEPLRLGPQIIRNTVLVHWLESGLEIQEVLARAGLKTPAALEHLRDYWG